MLKIKSTTEHLKIKTIHLKGKKILLGVTASIAAYKTPQLVRDWIKQGAEVKVIVTSAATAFVTPLSLATVSKNPVYNSFFSPETGEWTNHVDLGLWADVMVIAPCSANTLSKMASGACDNLLLATYLSARCPVLLAPAMDLDMFAHPATQRSISQLSQDGCHIIEPAFGELASGLVGKGRLPENEVITQAIHRILQKPKLNGISVLVSAGPTYEKIDSVRFIGNFSSGKMGFAIAEAFANMGANVFLVCGPNSIHTQHPLIKRIDVISAEEMFNQCKAYALTCQYVIMSAAVADFKPKNPAITKIKKTKLNAPPVIELTETVDILSYLGKYKQPNQTLVGFALEDTNELQNAKEKLINKNLDFVVLNSLNDEGAGFTKDTNKVTVIDKNQNCVDLPLADKYIIASQLVDLIVK